MSGLLSHGKSCSFSFLFECVFAGWGICGLWKVCFKMTFIFIILLFSCTIWNEDAC